VSFGLADAPAQRTVVVLAAGEGKRMRSALPKVLHPLLGRTMLGHVLAAARDGLPPADSAAGSAGGSAGPAQVVVVVGHGADQVRGHLAEIAPDTHVVLQAQQRGTGHAVRVAVSEVDPAPGTVVVLNGDIPLLRPQTLRALVEGHEQAGAAATVLTAEVPDATGLGRIIRSADGQFAGIIEERDATEEQRAIREINAGAYVFAAAALREMLGKLSSDNEQGEEYLTDVVGLLAGAGLPVMASRAADYTDTLGANDRGELAVLRALLRDRINLGWMRAGVTIVDPATTWIDVTVTLGRDAVIEPQTQLRGATSIGERSLVGPDTTLADTMVGADASVVRTHGSEAVVGEGATVGPFAYLRPGTRLGRKAKVGTFVETKNADIGDGAKVPHLSYVGDASVGEGTNIGAATVFVNYDGVHKHRTTIGAHARTGADNMFVAPVTVGDGAYTAAGSVITDDVPPGAMAVARGRQRNIDGWVERRRAGTAAATAAARASGAATAPAAAASASATDGPDSEESHRGEGR